MAASTTSSSIHHGQRCVAGGPGGVSCGNSQHTAGISIHRFPNRKKDSRRFRLWVQFVRRHRPNWSPSSDKAILCSIHFEESCFHLRRDIASSLGIQARLIKTAVPTIDAANKPPDDNKSLGLRERRKILRNVTREEEIPLTEATEYQPISYDEDVLVEKNEIEDYSATDNVAIQPNCENCLLHINKIKCLRKKIYRLKEKITNLKETSKAQSQVTDEVEEAPGQSDSELSDNSYSEDMLFGDRNENDIDWSQEEIDAASDDDENNDMEDIVDPRRRIRCKPGIEPADEPKFIVFYGMLMALFQMFCFNCKSSHPTVEVRRTGSMATVVQSCKQCKKDYHWRSQPMLFGKIPAGNLMMSFAILTSGVRISKVFLMFRHLGVMAISVRTFFQHQQKYLFPSILLQWEKHQNSLIEQLRLVKDAQWSGDGRFDSMGHNAKYGTYTMFCNSISKLVHFELIQSNQAGSSNSMELLGLKQCFEHLKNANLKISYFISDRHKSVAKWIRTTQPETTHFHDLWHVAKSITKQLLAVCKEKGNEAIRFWVKGIRSHLYWSVLSTQQGFGDLIVAKWTSIMGHISNKHDDHPNPLFAKCAHGDIAPRQWIPKGTEAYDVLKRILTNINILKDIKKLSSDAQTSCLEGFHSLLNHWHPKMTHFSWLGTKCRHALAILHFNENIHRDKQRTVDGEVYYNVQYPKFKFGDEIVREVTVPPTYGYIEEIKNLMLSKSVKNLQETVDLYSKDVPDTLTSQFTERKSRAVAVAYKIQRRSNVTQLYPTAAEQADLREELPHQHEATTETKARKCRKCQKPMKGHPRGSCPK